MHGKFAGVVGRAVSVKTTPQFSQVELANRRTKQEQSRQYVARFVEFQVKIPRMNEDGG